MHNFILFIRRFFNLILFLGLEIICLVLIARTKNMMQGNDVLSSANLVTGYIYGRRDAVVEYFGLRRMNDSLLNENLRLRTTLAEYMSRDTLYDLRVATSFRNADSVHIVHYAKYTYYQARVIGNSVSETDNYITINRGRKDGIRTDMAVVSGNGLVGRVMAVSEHFAVVLSILNSKQPVNARLKNGFTEGVYWEKASRPDELLMRSIPQEIKVNIGDSVVTSGLSAYYPRNILIGRVYKIERVKKDGSQILHLRPATNFRNMQYVYVIGNEFIEEQRQLESTLKAGK